MENKIVLFEKSELGKVRIVVDERGEPWFVAKDVCSVLGLDNVTKALLKLDEDEKGLKKIQTPGGEQEVNVINESGLYTLILRSNKPQAKRFRKWVTSEVLPMIRKYGGYISDEELFLNTYFPDMDEKAKEAFRKTLEELKKKNEEIRKLQPKAEYFDALVDRRLLTNFRDTAKELHIGQKELINWLLEKGYLYRDKKGQLRPYMLYVPELFEIKEWRNGKTAGLQTLVTPKGRETFRLLLKEAS
ncbi:MAG: phage antirepressor Ant [Epsilonproteobacteria bacterium]|nr:phage antirepressor Ant [Campylobacterota bacterium]